MKKKIALFLMCTIVLGMTACNEASYEVSVESTTETTTIATEEAAKPVDLEVVTIFAGNDGNAQHYKEYCEKWEAETGNTIRDKSTISDETFKTRVLDDFASGSEPDVLFFFNGADADRFIEAGKVVSLSEIQEEYPEFASNLDTNRIPASMVDNEIYAIPVNGYWEAMFVNASVLKAAGVEMPGEDYTWEMFLADCETLKQAGYTPIAASLGNIPHYWWEFAIFNHTSPQNHMTIPESVDDEIGQAWVEGMEDIKTLYELGYFPEDTNKASDDETFSRFMNGEAAFMIDGSWKVGSIVQNCQTDPDDPATLDQAKLDQFDVTFVPGTESRKANELIGGMSMGYYITTKAWENPDSRAAAVSFVSYMTSDEVTPAFAQHTIHALKNPPALNTESYNSLQIKAMDMLAHCASYTGAVQDVFQGDCRESTFAGMPNIVTGQVTAKDAVAESLAKYKEDQCAEDEEADQMQDGVLDGTESSEENE